MNGKLKILTFLSVVILVIPLLGFTRPLRNTILFITGISILLLTISVKKNIKTLKLKLKRIEGQQGTLIQ